MGSFPPVPWYTPFRRGTYRTSPDLHPFGTDFGAGPLDERWFQWDSASDARVARKLEIQRRRSLDVRAGAYCEAVAAAAIRHIRAKWSSDDPPIPETVCDEDPRRGLVRIASALPEDFALVVRDPAGIDRLAWLHVAFPSRWAPEEKIEESFAGTHAPVPGMSRTSEVAPRLFDLVRQQGPKVRFAWGIAFDPDPDQHPDRPRSVFDGERFWLRVERQVLAALPVDGAFLFTIRVHVQPSDRLRDDPEAAHGLASALRGMSPEARAYKGLVDTADALAALAEGFARIS